MGRIMTLALASTTATACAIAAPTKSAHAGLPVIARADVTAEYDSDELTLCATGWVDDGATVVGQWAFTIAGAAEFTPIHIGPLLGSGNAYPRTCRTVYRATSGALTATLTFIAAGDSDLAAAAGVVCAWGPLTGNRQESFWT